MTQLDDDEHHEQWPEEDQDNHDLPAGFEGGNLDEDGWDESAADALISEELGGDICASSPAIDELCDALYGVPPREAEEKIRETFRYSGGEVLEGDVLGMLLKVFRVARDAAIGGYETFESLVVFCDHLTHLCDINFHGDVPEEDESLREASLSPSVVGAVYAECGRTLALADHLPEARDRLEKALNVLKLVPENEDEATTQLLFGARSSLARVFRRLGHTALAREHYGYALRFYANLPAVEGETADFLEEFCEALGQDDADIPAEIPSLLADLAATKFGDSSSICLKVLRAVADACIQADQAGLAGSVLAARAKILRARCAKSGGGLALAEAEDAEEEAARTLEASLPMLLEKGKIEDAVLAWGQALHLRETLEGVDSAVAVEMRATLAALQAAACAARGGDAEEEQTAGKQDGEVDAPDDAWGDSQDLETSQSTQPSGNSGGYTTQAAIVTGQSARGPTALQGAPKKIVALRPSWMNKPAPKEAPKEVVPDSPKEAIPDSWDD